MGDNVEIKGNMARAVGEFADQARKLADEIREINAMRRKSVENFERVAVALDALLVVISEQHGEDISRETHDFDIADYLAGGDTITIKKRDSE